MIRVNDQGKLEKLMNAMFDLDYMEPAVDDVALHYPESP
jgi:hypothetical protein